MLLKTQDEDYKPTQKSLFLPIDVYNKLISIKKPTESLAELINRLLKVDQQQFKSNMYVNC